MEAKKEMFEILNETFKEDKALIDEVIREDIIPLVENRQKEQEKALTTDLKELQELEKENKQRRPMNYGNNL